MIQKESKAWLKVADRTTKLPQEDEGFLCWTIDGLAGRSLGGSRNLVRPVLTGEMADAMKGRIRSALGYQGVLGLTPGAYADDYDSTYEDREARVTAALLFAAIAADEEAAA